MHTQTGRLLFGTAVGLNTKASADDTTTPTMNAIRSSLTCSLLFSLSALAQTAGKAVIPAPAPSAGTSAPSPAVSAGGPVDNNTYIIGADDQLQITVWENTQLSASVVVRPDGKISLPLVNDIQAAGFTPTQLAASLTNQLSSLVKDPIVGVTVLNVRSKNIYMMGEVMHVGPIPIAPGMTALQAIATAGGLTPYAKSKSIYILRGDPGHQKKVPFNYKNAIKKGDMQGVSLQPGDTIVVP